MSKALFLDIDRTLLGSDRHVPKVNKDMIHRVLKMGYKVILNTGRPVLGAMCIVDELEFRQPGCYMIACNGSVLYDCSEDAIVKQYCLDPDWAVRLMRAAMDEGIHAHTYDQDRIICPGPRDAELDQYRISIVMPYLENVPYEDMHKYSLQKVMLVDLDGQERMGIFRDSHPEFDEYFQNFFSAPILLEYVQKGVNKGSAVGMFCEFAGIDIKDSIAMGDEENDIDMIRAAGLGVAMINAKDKVKEAADIVTTLNNDEGGVAEIIKKYML